MILYFFVGLAIGCALFDIGYGLAYIIHKHKRVGQ